MLVRLRLDGGTVRRWHVDLLARLAKLPGLEASVDASPGAGGLPANAGLLFALERLLYGPPRAGAAEVVPQSALDPYRRRDGSPDLTIDLCGDAEAGAGRLWRLAFDGAPGETALLASLMEGNSPVATVEEDGTAIAVGRLGTEHTGNMLASFADALARSATLVAAALGGGARPGLPVLPGAGAPAAIRGSLPTIGALGRLAARKLARGIVQRLYRLCYNTPHWRTGWRRLDGPDLLDLKAMPAAGWHSLPDDASRFYADPFPIERNGKVTLFVEDFPHRLGKGLISAVEFGPQGPIGQPQPVLELPYHLSYPLVFERNGEVWMIPESCANRTVDLYRATRFPGGWVHEATLLSGVVASDATLAEHDGRWWLFATVQDAGGAYSDSLHLWSAPDFRGPWTPHRRNPVLIDIASARPAGWIRRRGDALLRPVQDCRRGYGAALGIARIVRLDDDGFEQRVETILTAGAGWPGRRLHTLNAAGGFEFIDGSGLARRF